MKLLFSEYKKKVYGCYTGKNIGGVLGAPFEGLRQINNVEYYTQDLTQGPPPNDDLDLQLVWLNAVEKYGKFISANILGEYWLTYILPDWAEYGYCKNNLRAGLVPPLSGSVENPFGQSNGCFIRSEIWACLAPGRPEIATRYAYEDGIVDHYGEGVYAEIFFAAVESAAFVESDKYKLIDIGLSYIPENSMIARIVNLVIDDYKSGKTWQDTRMDILKVSPGTFGVQRQRLSEIPDDGISLENPGFDAPANLGITVLSWIFGEDDFAKTLCIAVNCGEDADCTAATIGAILGIIGGVDSIPENWRSPIGEQINSFCINELNGGLDIPRNVEQLTDRILMLAPVFLGKYCNVIYAEDVYEIETADDLYNNSNDEFIEGTCCCGSSKIPIIKLLEKGPYVVHYDFPVFMVDVDYIDGPYIMPDNPKKISIKVSDSLKFSGNNNQWVNLKLRVPNGVTVSPCTEINFPIRAAYKHEKKIEFEINTSQNFGLVDIIAEISINGRHSMGLVNIRLLTNN